MTSSKTRDCFVYLMLPGATEFVTAGKFVLSTESSGIPIGRFVYGARYMEREDAVAIDPVELKLEAGTFQTTKLKGVFGAIRDAGPDFWGRRIIEKHAGVLELGEMDYLLYSPDDRAGALGFGTGKTPPAPLRRFNRTIDLERLQDLADAILKNHPPPQNSDVSQVEELMLLGTSMGGARPKCVVEDGEGLWLAKFNCSDDRWNCGRVEHALLKLARACGLEVAQSRIVSVGNRDALLVKRFDRRKTEDGYQRARMVSGLTLLRAEESSLDREKWSYVLLAEELRRVSGNPGKDATELFRRMCFNALVSNIDDHPRNHAIIALDREWSLSPAYDLTPSPLVSRDRRDLAMSCGDLGRFANAQNLVSQCRRFHLEPDEARKTVADMEQCVRTQWYSIARAEGVTESDCETISGAFCYPGFHYQSLPQAG